MTGKLYKESQQLVTQCKYFDPYIIIEDCVYDMQNIAVIYNNSTSRGEINTGNLDLVILMIMQNS